MRHIGYGKGHYGNKWFRIFIPTVAGQCAAFGRSWYIDLEPLNSGLQVGWDALARCQVRCGNFGFGEFSSTLPAEVAATLADRVGPEIASRLISGDFEFDPEHVARAANGPGYAWDVGPLREYNANQFLYGFPTHTGNGDS